MSKVARLEVVSSGARRRWTLEEKQRIVAESYAASRQVSATARRNGLSASQLFTWRRLLREGRLVGADEAAVFAPALISGSTSGPPSFADEPGGAENVPSSPSPVAASGRIEIILPGGHLVIVDNGVDAAVLARVLAVLERP
jgi:transposase